MSPADTISSGRCGARRSRRGAGEALAGFLFRSLMFLLCGSVVLQGAGPVLAARDLPPAKGGTTYSLGMPPVWKGRAGVEVQWYRPETISEMAVYGSWGLSKSLGSPVVGLGALRAEGYVGFQNQIIDGGGRALFEIPSFHIGAGVDYNGSDEVWNFLLELNLPLRRGGLFGRGTTLALRWLPSRDHTFGLGVNVPLWGRNIGATRPPSDNVRLDKRTPQRLELELRDGAFAAALAALRERAHWVAELSQPFAETKGADAVEAMAPVVAGLKAHIDSTDGRFQRGHTLAEEIAVYHATLERAFALAADGKGGSRAGRDLALKARTVLLDEVLLPYNRLLGQRKTDDSLVGMIAVAQTEYANWVLSTTDLPREDQRRVWFVFQTLCDIMEENRARLRERWGDSRFVWLPLHYALTPDQHDSQAELDALIARAVEQPVTSDNRLWYVLNEQFQWEMARSVRKAELYHVLWIHDFRGYNGEGKPDAIAYAQTLNYLEALTDRVAAYDEAGRLPQYFILLDQHYFEINKARLWLRLLSAPLDYELDLPGGYEEWEERLRQAQDGLRQAVQESELLRVGASQYGRKWLKNLVKVHVNITNPADPSFWSWHIAGIVPIPDNMMRDHRKIAFYDVTEADPYRGMAMFTGMGIGEHYVGANWEDRALMIQGPGALAVKTAARGLLEAQGFEAKEIPYPLRARPLPIDYAERLAAERAASSLADLGDRGGLLQLHNETGFHDKPINVAKAIQYSLMPPGSVLKVPDSLWQSYIYASLLAGSAQRGCLVLVIAPTLDSAPSGAPPTLARAHGLMGRLITFSNGLEPQLTAAGGLLKVGLYAPRQGVGDIAGRFAQTVANVPAWADRIYPRNAPAAAVAAGAAALLDSLGYEVSYLSAEQSETKPKIHLKANFFASGVAWRKLLTRPELAAVLRSYIQYLAEQATPHDRTTGSPPDVRAYPEKMGERWSALVEALVADLTPAERESMIYYLTVGSTNMDYRSMVMDGEVQVIMGGWQALHGFLDFMLLPGLCEWLETTEELDSLLPPPSGLVRSMAGLMKLTL